MELTAPYCGAIVVGFFLGEQADSIVRSPKHDSWARASPVVYGVESEVGDRRRHATVVRPFGRGIAEYKVLWLRMLYPCA